MKLKPWLRAIFVLGTAAVLYSGVVLADFGHGASLRRTVWQSRSRGSEYAAGAKELYSALESDRRTTLSCATGLVILLACSEIAVLRAALRLPANRL